MKINRTHLLQAAARGIDSESTLWEAMCRVSGNTGYIVPDPPKGWELQSPWNQTISTLMHKGADETVITLALATNSEGTIDLRRLFAREAVDLCELSYVPLLLIDADLRAGVLLERCNLDYASFDNTYAPFSHFERALLTFGSFRDSEVSRSVFDDSIVRGVTFRQAVMRSCQFNRAVLKDSNFPGTDLKGSEFDNSYLKGVSFTNANLQGASFKGAELTKVDFTNANLRYANFTGAKLNGVKWADSDREGAVFDAS